MECEHHLQHSLWLKGYSDLVRFAIHQVVQRDKPVSNHLVILLHTAPAADTHLHHLQTTKGGEGPARGLSPWEGEAALLTLG